MGEIQQIFTSPLDRKGGLLLAKEVFDKCKRLELPDRKAARVMSLGRKAFRSLRNQWRDNKGNPLMKTALANRLATLWIFCKNGQTDFQLPLSLLFHLLVFKIGLPGALLLAREKGLNQEFKDFIVHSLPPEELASLMDEMKEEGLEALMNLFTPH